MYFIKPYSQLVVLTLAIGIAACSEDPVAPVLEPLPRWEEDDRFLYDLRVQYSAESDRENLYLLGRNHLSRIELEDSVETVTHSVLWTNYNQNYRMPVSSQLSLTANNQAVRLVPNRNPVLGQADFYLQLPDIDPMFLDFSFPAFHISNCMSINTQNDCLIPYYARSESEDNISKLLLVATDIKSYGAESNYVDTTKTWIITVPSGNVWALHTFDNDFYAASDEGTLKIDETRTTRLVSSGTFYKMFRINNQLYGLDNRELYVSDQGDNWNLLGEINLDFSSLNYHTIDGKTIAYYNSQLFHLENGEGAIEVTELDNAGIESHEITSVARLGSRIYVTTLSGVFFKEHDSFWTAKETEEAS